MRWFSLFPSKPKKTRGLYDLPEEAHIETVRKLQHKDKTASGEAGRPAAESSPAAPLLGLRVDVDTHEGMRDGVPRLLAILKEAGVRGTFYLAMGPDRSGKALLNVFRPGFLGKMLRTRAAKVYSMRTLLSGTLLPARNVALAFPEVARTIAAEGHETGVHGWDHRSWQDKLPKYSPDRMELETHKAHEAYEQIFGKRPATSAAPAWFCSDGSLRYQDRMGLRFASDCRGMDPFLPSIERRTLKTPQVPTTLATLDETLGGQDKDAESFFTRILGSALEEQWPVLTIHAELEGGPFAGAFASFLSAAREKGLKVVPLGELLETRLKGEKPLPRCTMSYGEVEGRSGLVSLQMLEV